jgi:hypothetical protein
MALMTMKSKLAVQRDPIPSTGNRAVRAGLDVVRVSKFLASGKGLEFLAKQQGLQLTNPNMESIDGSVNVKANLVNYQTKIFNPAKLIQNVAGDGIFPRHIERHGLNNDPRLLKYENLLTQQRVDKTGQNRLVRLSKDLLLEPQSVGPPLPSKVITGIPMALLSGPTGPSSILGAGQTNVRRAINSRTNLDWRTKRGSVTSFETKYTIEQPYFGLVPDPKNALEEKYKKNIQQAEVVKGVFDAKPVDINTQRYFALSYGQIQKKANDRTTNTKDINNFGKDLLDGAQNPAQKTELKTVYPLGGVFNTDVNSGNMTDYSSVNLEKTYGYQSYRGLDRSNTTKATAPDPVMNNDTRDIIDFIIGGIKFRAYIDNISDNFNPTWNETNDQGRADPKVMLASFTRSISVGFRVVATSRGDLRSVYDKLKRLARLTMPKYRGGGFTGDFVQLTIGNLYRAEYGYITGLSYDWDNETPWEIDAGIELPLYTNVQLDFTYIGNSRMSTGHNVFGYNFGTSKVPTAAGIADTNEAEDVDKEFNASATETPKAQSK